MSKNLALGVGIVTAAVLIYMVSFVVWMLSLTLDPSGAQATLSTMRVIFPIHIVFSIVSMGLFLLYILHSALNAKLETYQKIIWIVLILFFNIYVYPVYWYLHMWRQTKLDPDVDADLVAATFQ